VTPVTPVPAGGGVAGVGRADGGRARSDAGGGSGTEVEGPVEAAGTVSPGEMERLLGAAVRPVAQAAKADPARSIAMRARSRRGMTI
jgi:hypothetical protein